MERIFKGKNVRSAIKKGLKKLGVTKDEVKIEIVEEKTSPLYRLVGGGTRVKITLEGLPDSVEINKSCSRVKEYAEKIVSLIDSSASVKVEWIKTGAHVEIDSKKNELIIGRKGSTLEAIEYILNLIVKRDPDTRIDVTMDCSGYKKNINQKISQTVKKAAEKVKKNKKPVKLDPMGADKRKYVHRKVRDIKGVKSESSGSGDSRRVIIKKDD